MIYYYNFPVNVAKYAELGEANEFPELDCCPMCRAKTRLKRHGFYERNAIESRTDTYRIPICRLICPDCGKTISILPTFLLPYFQHTMDFIIRILLTSWIVYRLICSRQLRRFYEKRAYGKLTEIELFIREHREHENRKALPDALKEKAIKMLQMIQALGKATFVRRWWGHRISSFMAHSLYHGARVVKTI